MADALAGFAPIYQRLKERFEEKVALIIPARIHPNHLTCFRLIIILALPVAGFYKLSEDFIFWLVLLTGLSDTLDGIAARQRQQVTLLGAALDPLVDKIFTLVSATLLWQRGLVSELVILWILVVESYLFVIPALSFFRRLLSQRPPERQFVIQPDAFGRAKMSLLVVGFLALLFGDSHSSAGLVLFGLACVYSGLIVAGVAFARYLLDWLARKD